MITNTLKNNGKFLYIQKRLNFELIPEKNNYNDVIPFSFTEIDRIVKNRTNIHEKSLKIDIKHKNVFYTFIRKTNSIIYSSLHLKKTNSSDTKEDSLHSSCIKEDSKSFPVIIRNEQIDDETICERVEKILGFLTKENLIVVLQRSLSAHFYLKSKCWKRLSTCVLRNCFLNEEKLNSTDLVKILSSLSKWRFTNLSEFEKKLDLLILVNDDWTLYNASQALWSLSHLNLFSLKAFQYLNAKIIHLLCSNSNQLEPNTDLYESIHRICSSNLNKLSRTGIASPVLSSITEYFERNVEVLKCLDTKTMLSLTSLFPYSSYNDKLVTSVLGLLLGSFHKFTHAQASHILYNFSIIHSDLSTTAQHLVVKLLCKFRDLILASEFTFIPSMISKCLYTSILFLSDLDLNFVSMFLSDLNANLHLIGPFSLFGNLLCLNHMKSEFSRQLEPRDAKSIVNTMNKLMKVDDLGNLCKLDNEVLKPLEIKLWHLSVLNVISCIPISPKFISDRIYLKLQEFYEICDSENHMSTMKNFVLFLTNSFGNRDLVDTNLKNLTLLTSSKLFECSSENNEILCVYWDLITCYLSCFEMLDVFKREVKFDVLPSDFGPNFIVLRSLLNLLSCAFINDEKGLITYVEKLAHGKERKPENVEVIIVKFCLLFSNFDSIRAQMGLKFEDFYTSNGTNDKKYVENSDIGLSAEAIDYVKKCVRTPCKQINLGFLRTKLFFLQDHPRHFLPLLPSIIMGELLSTSDYRGKVDIYQIGKWLDEVKGWDCLSKSLKNGNIEEYREENGDEMDENGSKLENNVRIESMYSNWKQREMEVEYVLKEQYIGPWLCPYVIKGKDEGSILLIFPMDFRNKNRRHVFDTMRRDFLSKFGYNFIELYYS
uniref:RAP domain-containing protein n=1 Tax=Theileria annulata TaxID=5874 RepID=A0A3B0N4T9_THEAN